MLRLVALALGAFAPATFPVRTPVSAVAANETSALALTGNEVRIMDRAGFPLGRFPCSSAPSPLPRRRPAQREGGFRAAAGIVDDDDFNDPHDPDSDIEDPENLLVEDRPTDRRHARAVPRANGVAIAIGPSSAWVGRDDGLWRLSFTASAERVTLPVTGPVRQLAASPNGLVIVAALDRAIVWSDDGGAHFVRAQDAPVRVSRLLATDEGRAYALGGDRLWRLQKDAPGVEVISHGAGDVTACGPRVLALVDRRLVMLPRSLTSPGGERPDRGNFDEAPLAPPGADRVGCSPDGATWVAYGAALWVSEDHGHTWTGRDDGGATFAVAAVAVTHLALWVAGDAGLAILPLHGPSTATAESAASLRAIVSGAGGEQPLPWRSRWRWWLPALPRVDVGFAAASSNTRRDVRAFVLLSFTFDPRRDTRGERRLDADARALARREATQRSLARRAPADERRDPIAAEERDAMSRLLN